jgi:hypothetical protein
MASRICGVPALAAAVTARLEAHASRAAAIVIASRDLAPRMLEWFIDLRRPEAQTSRAVR